MRSFLAAVVQMQSTADKSANLATATKLIEQAAERGAQLVVLPELFNCLAPSGVMLDHAEPIPGPTSEAMCALAAQHDITLVAGSIGEKSDDSSRMYNTSLLIGPTGDLLARYRKIHLFDIRLAGSLMFNEADAVTPGDKIVATWTPIGRIAQATCYDLRFPELFRQFVDANADLAVLPSAFTARTGRDHWEVLVRARAIENQLYVVAANQFGQHAENMVSYGRSMIVDPWGTVLATAGDGEGVAVAEIDLDRQAEIRHQLPALKNRRSYG